MQVSIFSFITALVWSTIFITITYFVRKIDGMKKYYGIGLLFVLYMFSFFRIFFPLEFGFTKVIPAETFYADVYRILHLESINDVVYISILTILLKVWIIVAIVKVIKFIIIYNRTASKLLETSEICNIAESDVLKKVKFDVKKDLKVNIYKCELVNIPIGVGLLNKSIILPNKVFTDNELYYILLHEYTHFLNKDVIVKIMTTVFCYIFWWFPPIQLLKKDLEQVLEIKCDLRVAEDMEKKSKVEYLSVIVNSLKNIELSQKELLIGTALIEAQKKVAITERFEAVMNYVPSKRTNIVSYIIVIVFLFISILSYSYVVQPAYKSPSDGSVTITNEDTYILKTNAGKYFLYIDGVLNSEISQENVEVFLNDKFELIEEVPK